MTGTVAPPPYYTGLDDDGNPIPSGLLFVYAAGTSTKINTYTEADLATPNSNPIVLDAAGRAVIFLSPGLSYKFVLAAAGETDPPTSPLKTVDDIESVPGANPSLDILGTAGENLSASMAVYLSDGWGGTTAGRWYRTDSDATESSNAAGVVAMVPAAIATGVEGSIRLQGKITGLSGLIAGDIYYASATPGLLTNAAPTNAMFIGVADTTTSIVVQPSAAIAASIDSRVTVLETDVQVLKDDVTGIGSVNLCKDPTFLIWAAGDALAPTHWTLSGAGAAIARAGTGLADTTRKVGAFCAKVTAGGGAPAYLLQSLLTAGSYDDFLDGLDVSLGAWVWSDTAAEITLYIDDGATNSSSAAHVGDNVWQWMTVTHPIDAAATKLEFGMKAVATALGYLSGPTLFLSSGTPYRYQPAPCSYGTARMGVTGTVSVATEIDTYLPGRPGIVKYCQLYAKTAPVGADLIVDINSYNGAALTTMYTTKPKILDGAKIGGAAPDGTYARRCLAVVNNTTSSPTSAGTRMSFDVDQVGSGTAGSDLGVHVRILQFTSPMESFLGVADIS